MLHNNYTAFLVAALASAGYRFYRFGLLSTGDQFLFLVVALVVLLYWRVGDKVMAFLHPDLDDAPDAICITEAHRLLDDGWHAPPTGLYFRNRRGVMVHSRLWIPDGDPIAVVTFCHGYGASVGHRPIRTCFERYRAKGYAVIAIEHPGHGRSAGTRARIDSVEYLVDEVEDFITWMLTTPNDRTENPNKYTPEQYSNVFDGDQESMNVRAEELAKLRKAKVPLFLLGPSLGGLTVMYLSLRIQKKLHTKLWSRYRGTMFMCPAFGADRPPDWICKLMKFSVFYLVNPDSLMPTWLSKGATIPAENLFASPVLRAITKVDKWDGVNDKYLAWGRPMRWATASAIVNCMLELGEKTKEFKMPFMILHDEEDMITHFSGSETFFNNVTSQEKDLIRVPGGRHEMFANYPEFIESETQKFMKKRLNMPVDLSRYADYD